MRKIGKNLMKQIYLMNLRYEGMIRMETRKAKIIRTRPGGTAGKNSCGYRISLPSAWIRRLGMDSDNSEIDYCNCRKADI